VPPFFTDQNIPVIRYDSNGNTYQINFIAMTGILSQNIAWAVVGSDGHAINAGSLLGTGTVRVSTGVYQIFFNSRRLSNIPTMQVTPLLYTTGNANRSTPTWSPHSHRSPSTATTSTRSTLVEVRCVVVERNLKQILQPIPTDIAFSIALIGPLTTITVYYLPDRPILCYSSSRGGVAYSMVRKGGGGGGSRG